jgi:hypothetical protein
LKDQPSRQSTCIALPRSRGCLSSMHAPQVDLHDASSQQLFSHTTHETGPPTTHAPCSALTQILRPENWTLRNCCSKLDREFCHCDDCRCVATEIRAYFPQEFETESPKEETFAKSKKAKNENEGEKRRGPLGSSPREGRRWDERVRRTSFSLPSMRYVPSSHFRRMSR